MTELPEIAPLFVEIAHRVVWCSVATVDLRQRPRSRVLTFRDAPPPLGYDPGGIGVPGWDAPTSTAFAASRLQPWRLRALPGDVFVQRGSGAAVYWTSPQSSRIDGSTPGGEVPAL